MNTNSDLRGWLFKWSGHLRPRVSNSCSEGLPHFLLSPELLHSAQYFSFITLFDPSLNATSQPRENPIGSISKICISEIWPHLTTLVKPLISLIYLQKPPSVVPCFCLLVVPSPQSSQNGVFETKQTTSLPRSALSSGTSVHSEQKPKMGEKKPHEALPLPDPVPPCLHLLLSLLWLSAQTTLTSLLRDLPHPGPLAAYSLGHLLFPRYLHGEFSSLLTSWLECFPFCAVFLDHPIYIVPLCASYSLLSLLCIIFLHIY